MKDTAGTVHKSGPSAKSAKAVDGNSGKNSEEMILTWVDLR